MCLFMLQVFCVASSTPPDPAVPRHLSTQLIIYLRRYQVYEETNPKAQA